MDGGAWWVTVHSVSKQQTRLSNQTTISQILFSQKNKKAKQSIPQVLSVNYLKGSSEKSDGSAALHAHAKAGQGLEAGWGRGDVQRARTAKMGLKESLIIDT